MYASLYSLVLRDNPPAYQRMSDMIYFEFHFNLQFTFANKSRPICNCTFLFNRNKRSRAGFDAASSEVPSEDAPSNEFISAELKRRLLLASCVDAIEGKMVKA